jgi:hypothetical protein
MVRVGGAEAGELELGRTMNDFLTVLPEVL